MSFPLLISGPLPRRCVRCRHTKPLPERLTPTPATDHGEGRAVFHGSCACTVRYVRKSMMSQHHFHVFYHDVVSRSRELVPAITFVCTCARAPCLAPSTAVTMIAAREQLPWWSSATSAARRFPSLQIHQNSIKRTAPSRWQL